MKTQLALWTMLALLTPGAYAQAPAQPAAKPGEVTVIGCLQRQADYRALKKESAGLFGSTLGSGDEFVLMGAKPAQTGGRGAVGTAGTTAASDYSLTGKLENNLVRDVGRMVEVVGTVAKSEKEGELPRLTISLWHPVGDFCPGK